VIEWGEAPIMNQCCGKCSSKWPDNWPSEFRGTDPISDESFLYGDEMILIKTAKILPQLKFSGSFMDTQIFQIYRIRKGVFINGGHNNI
jgi:hypothetical protein